MAAGRRRGLVGGLVALIVALFAGHWLATFLSDRWWVAVVDPAASGFLLRWHLLGTLLELGGILLAVLWCVAHLLLVVGSISSVQVPRRLGDLEIRELLPHERLRTGAILAGIALGVLVGSGLGADLPFVIQGWRGVRFHLAEPALGVDLGVYLAQLPLWSAGLDFARRLAWVALLGAGTCHFLVGGLRVSRHGVAMTEAARVQLGLLVALALALAAMGEGIAPLRAVAGLEGGTLARLAPGVRWAVAVAWTVAALAMAWWTFRPAPGLVASGLGLWALSGLVSRLLLAGAPAPPTFPEGVQRQVAGAATGLDRLREEHAPVDSGPGTPPGPGLWSSQALAQLLEGGGGRPLGMTPTVLDQGGRGIPVWFAVRRNGAGPELVAIAEDRLAAGGAPVSYREGDPEEYPGVVAWRHLDQPMAMPDQGDTVVSGREGGVPLGGPVRRLLLAWGTQTPGILAPAAAGATLHWALPPRERAHRLLPMADWGEARPCLVDGTLHWVVEGWLTGEGAPLAPPVPWDGGSRRYLRPAFIAVVAAGSGATRLYLHPTADPLAAAWAGASDGAIVPAESLPPAVRALPMSDLDLAVKGYALTHGPFGLFPESGPALLDSLLPRPVTVWTPAGPMPQLALTDGSAAPPRAQRLDAVLLGGRGEGPRLIRWADGAAPRAPRGLEAEWQRFATWEQLQDSLGTAGARLLAGPVRYDIGPRGTVAVQPVYAMGAPGVPALVWVELARGDRLGAARSPAAAWSNLRGESAPLVPAPDLPDALGEARRWAARADSLLRAGDLEGFGRAFGALKRVLGTP